MKLHRPFALLLTITALTVFVSLNCKSAQADAHPVLVFKGYSSAETNTMRVAKFELRNESNQAIWLCYGGREAPLSAPFLVRRTRVTVEPDNTNWVVTASIGHWFMEGVKLSPGQNTALCFPLVPGKPALEVGIEYYVGGFKDAQEFTAFQDRDASQKEKADSDTEKPRRCEVWCPQTVCYQAGTSNTPTVHSERPDGDKR